LSVPSNTLALLDRLSAPGSSPPAPFRAARTPFGVRCRHFDSATRTACCRSRRIGNFPDTSLCRTVISTVFGTFHDSRTESVVFQAAFRWWDSGSRPQLLGSFPLPRGYLPAPSPGRTTDERRGPGPPFVYLPCGSRTPVPGQTGLASGRHHGRVFMGACTTNGRSGTRAVKPGFRWKPSAHRTCKSH